MAFCLSQIRRIFSGHKLGSHLFCRDVRVIMQGNLSIGSKSGQLCFPFAIGQTLNKTVPQNLGDIDLGENGYCRNSLQQ